MIDAAAPKPTDKVLEIGSGYGFQTALLALLAGRDFETALRLGEGQRTSVFRRFDEATDPVYSWYLRLWDWRDHDLLYGLLRLERVPDSCVLDDVHEVSRWLLAERAPLAARDRRWDRLLYPMHQVEQFLKARAGAWQVSGFMSSPPRRTRGRRPRPA